MLPDTCPKCNSSDLRKNGYARGKPRRQCKNCCYQFTRADGKPKKPAALYNLAIVLYLSGLSMNRIAGLCGVSAQSILNWIRKAAIESYEKPAPTSKAIVMELDEMWHYVKKNLVSCGSGKPSILILVPSLTGNAVDAIRLP